MMTIYSEATETIGDVCQRHSYLPFAGCVTPTERHSTSVRFGHLVLENSILLLILFVVHTVELTLPHPSSRHVRRGNIFAGRDLEALKELERLHLLGGLDGGCQQRRQGRFVG